MPRYYVNAEAVLSVELLEAVSKAVGGRPAFLWIAARQNLHRKRRDQFVLALHADGWDARKIADRMFLSERTVYRILARKRAAAAPSATPHGPESRNPDDQTRR
jgi:DNA-binding NarL/FixJ family response regulator